MADLPPHLREPRSISHSGVGKSPSAKDIQPGKTFNQDTLASLKNLFSKLDESGTMWICMNTGLVIWLWIYDSEEASLGTLAQMKFPIMVTFSFSTIFWNLWLSYSSEIISFLLLTVCTVLSQQGIWREKNWDNYFGADSSRDVLFSVNRCVIRTILLCLLTKRAKIVFGNETVF